jgi:hypothetical protein
LGVPTGWLGALGGVSGPVRSSARPQPISIMMRMLLPPAVTNAVLKPRYPASRLTSR